MISRKCDVENLSDLARYYAQSWVGLHDSVTKKLNPIVVGHMYDELRIQIRRLDKEGNVFRIREWENKTLEELNANMEFGRPDIGMVDDGGSIAFLAYSTPRAPHKGLRTRDTKVTLFNDLEMRNYRSNPGGPDRYDWIWWAFNPQYQSFSEAYEELESGKRIGVPLSRTVGLYTREDSAVPLLAYKRWTIGYVHNKGSIRLNSAFEEYRNDIQRQTGVEVQVL